MLESHTLMIKEQIEVMKGGVESRKDALVAALQKFASRWEALKPKEAALENSSMALAAIGFSFPTGFILSHFNSDDQGEAH
jgi:dynein heavy chain 2